MCMADPARLQPKLRRRDAQRPPAGPVRPRRLRPGGIGDALMPQRRQVLDRATHAAGRAIALAQALLLFMEIAP